VIPSIKEPPILKGGADENLAMTCQTICEYVAEIFLSLQSDALYHKLTLLFEIWSDG